MAHHDTHTSPTQGHPKDEASQQGSGDMTGAPDQGGSGQTSEPRMGETGSAGTRDQLTQGDKTRPSGEQASRDTQGMGQKQSETPRQR